MNVRPFGEADFVTVARVLADDESHHFGRPSRIGEHDVREWTSLTDLGNDSWLYEDDDGAVAVGWAFVRDDLGVGVGAVHPRAKGRGLGRQLAGRSESRSRDKGARRMHQFTLGPDRAAVELLTRLGYRDVRHFYDMAIELTARPGSPPVEVRTVEEGEEREFHAALDEAFRDHWEHVSRTFDEWWAYHSSNPNFDRGLWFVIRDGDEIAAASRNEANRNGGGYVGAIGVRRAFRGRGYAKALLHHTFGVFYDRGITRVTLGVDAASPTGATQLYERVGMHVEAENVVFEKMLA